VSDQTSSLFSLLRKIAPASKTEDEIQGLIHGDRLGAETTAQVVQTLDRIRGTPTEKADMLRVLDLVKQLDEAHHKAERAQEKAELAREQARIAHEQARIASAAGEHFDAQRQARAEARLIRQGVKASVETVPMPVRLEVTQTKLLKLLAQHTGTTSSAIIRDCLADFIDRQLDSDKAFRDAAENLGLL
jgi:predicted DNA-binding protein